MKRIPRDPGPTPAECRRAADILISEHLSKSNGAAGCLKREIRGRDRVAVYTVSGRLVDLFDRLLYKFDPDWAMGARETAIDVRPAAAEIEGEI